MRKVFTVLLFLLAALALSETATVRPPIPGSDFVQTVTARATSQADLQRAGYTLGEMGGTSTNVGMRQRWYNFAGSSGSSMRLTDNEYPAPVGNRRELVFEVVFSVKEGRFPGDISSITPKLVAAAQSAVRQNSAVVAGLGYLATAAASNISPEALQIAVSDYIQRYRQPSAPLREMCSDCASGMGFGDEYDGGADLSKSLNVEGSDWKIAGNRHYLNGRSAFTIHVTANIPRS